MSASKQFQNTGAWPSAFLKPFFIFSGHRRPQRRSIGLCPAIPIACLTIVLAATGKANTLKWSGITKDRLDASNWSAVTTGTYQVPCSIDLLGLGKSSFSQISAASASETAVDDDSSPDFSAGASFDSQVASPTLDDVTSSNWSGYVATAGQGQAFNSIESLWTIPTVKASPSGTTYSAFWVGLDGYTDDTVEQCGISGDITAQGGATYYPWYELYPASEVEITTFTVNPGDMISAEVTFTGGSTYTFTLMDLTDEANHENYMFSKAFTSFGDARSSAEWIAEAPSIGGQQSNLANYGSVTFSNDMASLSGGSDATLGSFNPTAIQMVQNNVAVSTPSAISNGDVFTITYVPEPSTWGLMAAGFGSLLAFKKSATLSRRAAGLRPRRDVRIA